MAFKEAFMDIGEKLSAHQQLDKLSMQGGDVGAYITAFNHLIKVVGYTDTDLGTIIKFQQGLNPKLLSRLIMLPQTPTTLQEWQQTAREQQLKYMEAQHALGQCFSDPKKALYQQMGIGHRLNQGQQNGPPHHNLNAMNVDAIQAQSTFTQRNPQRDGRPIFDEKQKEALKLLGACFRCEQTGHMA